MASAFKMDLNNEQKPVKIKGRVFQAEAPEVRYSRRLSELKNKRIVIR